MPLLLAVHTVEVETARVPLSMIILTDYIKRRSLPSELKCRIVMPSGSISVSLWDAPSQAILQEWLDTTLAATEPGLVSTCHEVQEDFSYGLALELAQKRAAEKVAERSREAMRSLSMSASEAKGSMWKQIEEFDRKTNLLTATEEAFLSMRAKTNLAMESPKVTSAMSNISEKLSTANTALSWFGSRVRESFARVSTGAENANNASSTSPGGFAAASQYDDDAREQMPFPVRTRSQLSSLEEVDEEGGSPDGPRRPAAAVYSSAAAAPEPSVTPAAEESAPPSQTPWQPAAPPTFILEEEALELLPEHVASPGAAFPVSTS